MIEPIIIPFTKCFCRNGYTQTTGAVVTTIVAYCNDVELTVEDAAAEPETETAAAIQHPYASV